MSQVPTPGSIVSCRDRQWVVLPSENSELVRLRPLSGNEDQICGIFTPLELESSIESAKFPNPTGDSIQDCTAAQLLIDAARLNLRSGAGPFRCLGRLSLRPRPYQLVPLLMGLRLDTIRLLIADDVGIGKTIEAGLIAKELLDRGEIKRLAVLCPPQLCDQWQRELKEKFHIDAVVIRSGTVSKLERNLPSREHHIFSYYPHIIVSLDYAKSDRRRASLLTYCPDLVIVDEVHTCASSNKDNTTQQRHQLVKEIAENYQRHLVLLTATPHSGIETAFLSILGLLKREFANFDLDNLTEKQRQELAQHFVQRRRADVQKWLGNETPFPQREALESTYNLSKDYRKLFDDVYDFARGLVKTGANLSYAQKRGRYWSALAIVRCVMSSPAAAIATLSRQVKNRETEVIYEEDLGLNDEVAATYVYDPTEQEQAVDVVPNIVVEKGQLSYVEKEKRQLKAFVKAAEQLLGEKDRKLQQVISLAKDLLREGFNFIIWCRYIATAKYLADALKTKFETSKNNNIRVIAITGELSEDEREIRLAELTEYPQRIMVATDCLSEGVNLQTHFTATIHYDLPWNPNRLEQREGRIDRYGQTAPQVKCILFYGEDNPVDGAVLDVLIRKAVKIHQTLGVTVPVPMDSSTVQEAVFKSLFEQADDARQLSIFDILEDTTSAISEVHQRWDIAAEKEKLNRTRFAQRTIKPTEVEQELIESDKILGTESDVEQFVKRTCARLNASLIRQKNSWHLPNIPKCLIPILGAKPRTIAFTTPTPENVEYVGRNHPLVEGLAQHILGEALNEKLVEPIAARCGLVVTNVVDKPKFILLLRLRHLLTSSRHQSLLVEECLTLGFTGIPSKPNWLFQDETWEILARAEPVADLKPELKKQKVKSFLARLKDLQPELEKIANQRAEILSESHCRVRAITKEGKVKVEPLLPMDILGVYLLKPN